MNELNIPRIPALSAFLKRCATRFKMVGVTLRIVVGAWLATGLAGCGKATSPAETATAAAPSGAGTRDHLVGWFKLPGRNEKKEIISGEDTLIPVFKRDGTYFSVDHGREIPFKECPEGLEWALTPSSLAGTKIGFNAVSNVYYIVIEDRLLEHNWQHYVSGERRLITRTSEPSGPLDAVARPPRTNKDFVGWYQPVWFPLIKFEIRRNGDRYVGQQHEFSGPEPGSWKKRVGSGDLFPLPDQLGFGLKRDYVTRILYNDILKRFELVTTNKETTPSVIRIPLARVSGPSLLWGAAAPSPMVRIGIPSWH